MRDTNVLTINSDIDLYLLDFHPLSWMGPFFLYWLAVYYALKVARRNPLPGCIAFYNQIPKILGNPNSKDSYLE